MLSLATVFIDLLILSLLCAIYKAFFSRSFPRLPPGPRTAFLGRVNLPAVTNYPWKTYVDWKKTYGTQAMDLLHLNV